MKIKTFLSTLAVIASLLLSSCKDDDGYSLGKFWVGIATVENPDGKNHFFFKLDSGDKMWTAATNLPSYRPKDGQRIIANYTILSDRGEGNPYNHDVKLNNVYSILTKDLISITTANSDSLGNDPIYVSDIWISNDFLNIEFKYFGLNRVHYINLGSDDSKSYSDGKIHLELRHNANGDSPMYSKWGVASFRLRSLQVGGASSVKLVIHTKEPGGKEKVYELVYDLSGQQVKPKSIVLGDDVGNIE